MKRVSIFGAVSAVMLLLPVAMLFRLADQLLYSKPAFSVAEWRRLLGFLFYVEVAGGFLPLAAAGAAIAAAAFALTRYMSPSIAAHPACVYAVAILAGIAVNLAVIFVLASSTWAPE